MGPAGVLALLARAARKDDEEWDKADVYEAIYWLRYLVAVAGGVACGMAGGMGLLTFVGFIVANAMAGSLWLKYQDIDTHDFPENQPVAMEALPQSVSLFVLCWTIAYSLAHF